MEMNFPVFCSVWGPTTFHCLGNDVKVCKQSAKLGLGFCVPASVSPTLFMVCKGWRDWMGGYDLQSGACCLKGFFLRSLLRFIRTDAFTLANWNRMWRGIR